MSPTAGATASTCLSAAIARNRAAAVVRSQAEGS